MKQKKAIDTACAQLRRPGPRITNGFWDFIEKYLPDYSDREDVLRQGCLQFFIDGHDTTVMGEVMSRDEAEDELHLLLYTIHTEAIDAYTKGGGIKCEHCDGHRTKYCPYCGRMTGNDKVENPFRCVRCGSADVRIRAWIHPNENDRISGFCSDGEDGDSWCEKCEEHTGLKTEEELLEEIDGWWDDAGFEEMERVSGYRRTDFSPEDGYREFVDACNKYWEGLPVEEKIEKWLAFNNRI
jgi:hypothetical protein